MSLGVQCSVRDAESDPRQTFTAILGILQRSKAPVTVLHFDHGHILTADILYAVKKTPTLEDLRLADVDEAVVDKVLLELILKPNGPAFVPSLGTLYLSEALLPHMHTLRELLESRWTLADTFSPPVRRLAEVSL
ncbi:uncharacterized protein EV420DRAFT_1639580 [Desarmillaria tabescens]|uniref:Uncharacterized protein n=1 Tax=Armillaria tabescens TaxID=1929756 RepID=A0AA39TSJ3_ARMTA|nr:uncharacterized protein EV420DRAFT_1639580 [Desarmillaria tabescens]KAK0462359.1 hypothetical protein EV420DRAFT_1639580 [Desarmillaria tabescens]